MKISYVTTLFLFLLFTTGSFAQTAEIGNLVWEDLDADGIQDAGEPGIPGVTVTLAGNDVGGNPVSLMTTTNSTGLYLFTSLLPGTYNLTFGTPTGGYTLTSQNQGGNDGVDSDAAPGTHQTVNTVLVFGESDLSWDAGFYKTAALKSFVWNDLDKNGLQDGGEPGIPGQTVTLSGTSGSGNSVNLSGSTDALGDCQFGNLQPGTYKLAFTYPPGCQSASPKDQGANDATDSDINALTLLTANETLTSGEINDTYDAGFYQGTVLKLDGTQCGPGEITATIESNIHPPIHYDWSNTTGGAGSGNVNQQTFTIAVPVTDTYTVTTTDALGCSATATYGVVVTPAIVLSHTIVNGLCFGNGSIDLNVSGGNPGYSYIWSNGPTTQDQSNLTGGTYTVTVTDAMDCTKTISATISQPTAIVLSLTKVNVLCNGASSGTIDLTAAGGVAPFSYLWSNTSTTQDLIGLTIGTYTVTVTDSNGCTKTSSASITQPTAMVLSTVQINVGCYGASNGSINLSPSGGVIPFTYLWTNSVTTQDISGLTAGTYTVTVTDANGCTKTISATITQSTAITLSTTPSNPTCGNPNGFIDLTATGGIPPYTYSWATGAPTQDLLNLVAGTYTVTVTDANGCTKTISTTITQAPPINLSAVSTATPCGGAGNEGAIDLTPSGGTPAYTYFWTNSATTQDISGLMAGTYTVTVTDANNCTASRSVTVQNGVSIPLSSFSITNTSCNLGATDGAITITTIPPAAQAPLVFVWQGPNAYTSSQQDITGLAAGNYALSITDITACTYFATIAVDKDPSTMDLNLTTTNAVCDGVCNGSLDLTVSNGNAPYTYNWSNGSNAQDLNNLCAGVFTVTVTDALGCSKTASTTFTQTPAIILQTTVTNISCNGQAGGMIDLLPSGGIPGYAYNWSNGATTQDLTNLSAGTYTVTVTDLNGCTKTTAATVTQPPALSSQAILTPISCNGGSNGAIDVTSAGGTPPYTYAWNNGATTQDLNNLTAGVYVVTITDAQGCTFIINATIAQPVPFSFDIVSLSNDCSSETITGPNVPNQLYSWTGPNNFIANSAAITAVDAGVYSLTITNFSGCTASSNYTVTLSANGTCGRIHGRVIHDAVENCLVDPSESALAGWLVRAEGVDTLYGVTNVTGEYYVGAPVGTYTMKVMPPNSLWQVCPGGSPVSLTMPNDTVFGGDFPVQSLYTCPSLSVSIGTNQLRRCFSNNYYFVEYCNEGTVPAEDAFVLVTLDPFLTFIASSIPSANLGNNVFHFNVGDLEVGECGAFYIQVQVNCTAVLGQTHCTVAHIFPDTICPPSDPNWSGASLSLRSVCSNDSLHFIIKNIGDGNMNSVVDYIVIEDAVMLMSVPLQPLQTGDSMTVSVPANGSTWRMEVGQESFHPDPTSPALSVEGCTTSPSFSTGFVNQFPLSDGSSQIDIDCTTNIGSYDPNDKYGYPVGYGTAHYVRPGTEIEYLIRFQNTGTDTAFRVEIIDTLSAWLDPASIHFGVSSHRYHYDLNGEGIVHFIFDNILLPDSNTNEVASHGFAKFRIKPREDLPLETLIENTAAIYFDFNDPIFTNTTFHRLGEDFVAVGLWQPFLPGASVNVVPNPFSDQTVLEIKGLSQTHGLRLQVFDLQGNIMREMTFENAIFNLKRGDWPGGVYLFNITQHGRQVGSGKLITN